MIPVALQGAGFAGADLSGLSEFVPPRTLRRIDRFSRMALLASFLALRDGGLPLDPEGTGVVVATGYGATRTTFAFLDTVLADGDALASPTHFSTSVHNAAASTISLVMGIHGPTLTVSQFEGSVASGFLTASAWLAEGRAKAILLVAVDEGGEVVEYCRREAGEPAPGEGAAAFLLLPPGEASPSRVAVTGARVSLSPLPGEPGCPMVEVDPGLGAFPVAHAWGVAEAARLVREGKAERAGCKAAGRGGAEALVLVGRP